MLNIAVHRAELRLQSHQAWLHQFLARPPGFPHLSQTQYRGHVCSTRYRAWPVAVKTLRGSASYATKRGVIRTAPGVVKTKRHDESIAALADLREAIQEYRIKDVMEIYRAMPTKGALGRHDMRTIAQCLHRCSRIERRVGAEKRERVNTEAMMEFANDLVQDIVKGNVVPNIQAHVHIIGIFKESGLMDEGVRFWKWLESQDDRFTNADVYGAAIELLAVDGAPLTVLEDLYRQALSRFPGNFNAYHLSPEAIVPDRSRHLGIKGIPMSLLQGIVTARLLRGDVRNAYLALDTALRLLPDVVPPRFFALFLEERPLPEAYTIFAVACRAGIVMPVNHFMTKLRNAIDPSSPMRHLLVLRAMVSSTYLHIGSGGSINTNLVNGVVIALTRLLRLDGMASIGAEKMQQVVDVLMDTIRQMLEIFARYGGRPGIAAFNSVITNLGGFGHSKKVVGMALADMKALRLEPNNVTRRSILNASGTLGDVDFLKRSWRSIVEARASQNDSFEASDFHVLIKAARLVGEPDFAQEMFDKSKGELPLDDHEGVITNLETTEQPLEAEHDALDVSMLLEEITKLRQDLTIVDNLTEDSPQVQDFSHQLLPMTLLPPRNPTMPESATGNLYDELTTEDKSRQPPAGGERSGADAAVSATNLPFDRLRYEHWKSINYLLEQADVEEKAYTKTVDEAIAAGVPPPARMSGSSSLPSTWGESTYGLGDTVSGAENDKDGGAVFTDDEVLKGRARILALRGRLSDGRT